MGIRYAWHSDDQYYATVVRNQYRQLPLLLRLRTQAIILWIILGGLTLSLDLDFRSKSIFLCGVTAFAYVFPFLVKRGIILKYRLRPTLVQIRSSHLRVDAAFPSALFKSPESVIKVL